jgi:hypothetical protein
LKPARVLRLLAQNALVGIALLATLATSALFTMRVVLDSRDVAVPALNGRTLHEAEALVATRGLSLRIEGRRHDGTVPAERVVSQEPPPGRRSRPTAPCGQDQPARSVSVPRWRASRCTARSAPSRLACLARVIEAGTVPRGTGYPAPARG